MVTLVTLLEKPPRLPRTFDENEDTLLTTDAASADPGIFGIGMEGGLTVVDDEGTETG